MKITETKWEDNFFILPLVTHNRTTKLSGKVGRIDS